MSTETTGSLAAALAAVQAELPEIRKGETAEVKSERTGKTYKYSYADLADVSQVILPLLGKHGLAWITKPTFNAEGKFVLAYKLRHVSGEEEAGEYPLPDRGTPQEIGSAITYARRYALCAVTGVAPAADDDDGAAATQRAQRDQWDDARPAGPSPEQVRQNILANARKAIAEAIDQPALDGIGNRITAAVNGGGITEQDGIELRRLVVARLDELFPAGEQAATDWPDTAQPGDSLVAAAFDQHKRGVHSE